MQVQILERDDNRVRFVTLDDNGQETGQHARPIGPLLEKARKQRKSLGYVLARELGAALPAEEAPLAATVDVQTDSGIALKLEDLFDQFAGVDHEHPELADHASRIATLEMPHQHRGEIELRQAVEQLTTKVLDLEAMATSALAGLERKLAHHDHEVPNHPHPSLTARLEALEGDVRGLEGRPAGITTLDGTVSSERFVQVTTEIRHALVTITQRIDQVAAAAQERPAGIDEAAVEAIVARVLAARTTTHTVREISNQKVDGKRRFVVEEI